MSSEGEKRHALENMNRSVWWQAVFEPEGSCRNMAVGRIGAQ